MKTQIEIGSKIRFEGEETIFEVTSIREDGKFYFENIDDEDEAYTGYINETTGFEVL
jgi:hypothetical protein